MDSQYDLHHLVALMSYESRCGPKGSALQPDTPSHLGSSIVDKNGIRDQGCRVLDALAHISISQPNSQVIAIALQLKCGGKETRLTIADNQEVGDSLVTHLNHIWGKLKALSDQYAEQRTKEIEQGQIETPKIPGRVPCFLKIEIFRDIYKYCLEKERELMEKWLRPFSKFLRQLKDQRRGLGLEEFELKLSQVEVALILVQKLVFENPETELSNDEWGEVYLQTMTAKHEAQHVLEARDRNSCEELAHKVKGDFPGDPFPLKRALEELISLPHHIQSLFTFARSQRLRFALRSHMTISIAITQYQIVKLPSSRDQWKCFLQAACGQNTRWQVKDAMRLFKKFGTQEQQCPVHSECVLIQYLQTKHGDSWDSVPAFSYIGVSQLSCSACRIWMETFNKLGGPKFYTRGSCGKWYWPWGMPILEVPLKRKMTEKVLNEYIALLERKGKFKKRALGCRSDLAYWSEDELSDATLQSAIARARAMVQEDWGGIELFGDFGIGRDLE